MTRALRRQLWFAKFNRRTPSLLNQNFPHDVLRMLDPDRRVKRYNRVWRLSQPLMDRSRTTVTGKLGFVRPSAREQVTYDEVRHDFVTELPPVTQGNFAHFVIDLETRILAFVERPPDIRRQSFLGAMQKLAEQEGYELDPIGDERDFQEWVASVDSVTRVHAKLLRKNPGLSRADEVRALIDDMHADRTVIDAVSDDGLVVDGTILEGAAEHVADGNGRLRATGISRGRRRIFDSARRLLTRAVALDPESSDEQLVDAITSELQDVARARESTDDALEQSAPHQ